MKQIKYISLLALCCGCISVGFSQTGEIADEVAPIIDRVNEIYVEPLIKHEIVPLVLEIIEPELCEDGTQQREPGIGCDDKDSYTKDDVVLEDGCTCAGEIPPIEISYGNPSIQYSDNGLPAVDTVRSVDVMGGGAPYCSMIARLNLKQFFPEKKYVQDIGSTDTIAMGDAVTLIEDGIHRDILTKVEPRDIQDMLDAVQDTVIDIFLYTPNGYGIDDQKRYLQGHRAVIFQADDLEWYVLDPLRGTADIHPQVLREYMYHYTNKHAGRYMYTQQIYPETLYEFTDEGFLVDVACEIQLHQSMMQHQGIFFSSEQVCFDIVEVCSS